MPRIEPRYEINTLHAKDCDQLGDQERSARQADIDRLMRYVDGAHDAPLRVLPNKRDDNIIVNITGQAADDVIDFVGTPDRLELEGGDTTDKGAGGDLVRTITPAQQAGDDLYEEHRQIVRDLVMSLLTAGHAFTKTYLDDKQQPTFDAIDPRVVTVFTNAFKPREVVFYRLQWKVSEKVSLRQDIVPAWAINAGENADETLAILRAAPKSAQSGEADTRWLIIDWRMANNGVWEVEAVDWWGYDFSPITDRPVKRKAFGYYGTPILKDAPALNDAYNFIISNIGRILYFHAHPRTIALGVTNRDMLSETGVDGVWTLATGDIKTIEMQSDLSSSMAFADKLRGAFFTRLQVVDSAGIGDKVGKLTNFGLRMLYGQMYDLSDKIREAVGAVLADTMLAVLNIADHTVDAAPEPIWSDPLPADRLEQVKAAEVEAALGTTSKQTLAEDLGRDFEREQERMRDEEDEAAEKLAEALAMAAERGGNPAMNGDGGAFNGR